MLTKKVIVLLICITFFTSFNLFAQYTENWSTSSLGIFLGCEDTDGDGAKELVFGYYSNGNIQILDPLSGTVEWDSGNIGFGIYTGYVFPTSAPQLLDVNDDGIFEILYRTSSSGWGLIQYNGSSADPNSPGSYEQLLHQNYPNPFNPETTIKYQLKNSGYVELKIYNVKGQLVQTLVKEEQSTGRHSAIWNAKGFSSGQYFYQISLDGKAVQTKKAIVLK